MWNLRQRLQAEANEAEGSPAGVEDAGSISWDDLIDEDSTAVAEAPEGEVPPEPEVGGEPEPEPEPTPPTEAVAQPEPQPVVEVKPEVAPPVVTQEAPAPAVVSQPPSPEAPPVTEEQLREWRQQVVAGLEQVYALDADAATALQVEPEKVLPKLAANLHLQIYDQVMRTVVNSAPALIQQTMQRQAATQAAESAFYSKWEELRPYQAQVNQVAQMWRQMYPQASLDEAIDGVGKAVKAMLGLQPSVPPQSMPMAPPPPAGPSSRTAAPRARKSSLSPEAAQFVSFADEIVNEEF